MNSFLTAKSDQLATTLQLFGNYVLSKYGEP